MKIRTSVFILSALLGIFSGSQAFSEENPSASKEWPSYFQELISSEEGLAAQLSNPDDPQLRHELQRLLYAGISQGYFSQVYGSAEYPDFWPLFNSAFRFVFPNPDDSYYLAPVDPNGVYKISGFRGTARIVDFQIGSGTMLSSGPAGGSGGMAAFGSALANHDLDHDVHLKKDGSFEVLVSPTRPEGYRGDWWKLEAKTTYIAVRQIHYDWLHEIDGRMTIDRLDRPAMKPRESADQMSANMKQAGTWAVAWTQASLQYRDLLRKKGSNTLVVQKLPVAGGITTQYYVQGMFDVGPDEALILETEIPQKCRYWSFELTDELIATLDLMNHQINLNGHTAKLDKDGKFRAVISAKDPGVPNWLDNEGYTSGAIFGRWHTCSSNPLPTLKKVKFSDVRQYLPSDTPVVSAEARDAAIRLRRKGAQLRSKW